MSKINISFNNKKYSIDESTLSTATNALQQHLSTTMKGSGAIINFGKAVYNVDSAKLSAASNDFVSYLRTIAGNGYKVVIGGVEYSVDSAKVHGAISSLDTHYNSLVTPDSVEDLQNQYEFVYFSTFANAVNAVNNGTINNYDATQETAIAGVYTDENRRANVVLLKDVVLTARVSPSVDMTINLGGRTISCSDTAAIDVITGNITIDGRLNGSTINTVVAGSGMARAFQVRAGRTTVVGGTYTAYSESGNSCGAMSAGTLTLSDATVFADGISGANKGLQINAGSTATITNCHITANTNLGAGIGILNNGTIIMEDSTVLATTTDGKGTALANDGTATVSNSIIMGYSDYFVVDGQYAESSHGISSTGTLTINNSTVYGAHSGLQNYGTLRINGGTYTGYGHGGLYFAGSNYTSYVQNASIKLCEMPEGYSSDPEYCNNAAFYIGGSDGNNKTVYMDGCEIVGAENTTKVFVLQSSYGSYSSTLLISNSTINEGAKIRIDNGDNKLYIGAGCNFTADDTNRPSAVVSTNETYVMN